jgi:hypothetical protein
LGVIGARNYPVSLGDDPRTGHVSRTPELKSIGLQPFKMIVAIARRGR